MKAKIEKEFGNWRRERPTVNLIKKYALALISVLTTATLVFLGASSAQAVNAGSAQHLDFTNTVKIGANATEGFTNRYSNIISGVDAILTVIGKNNTTVNNVDRVSTIDNWQIWTNENLGAGGGYVKYRVDFVVAGTNNPTTLENLAINVGDIDAKQYVQFAGPTSYTLGANSQLQVQTHDTPTPNNPNIPAGSFRFAETSDVGSLDADTRYWAQVNYASISSVDIELGASKGGAALFQVAFGSAPWNGAAVTPVPAPVQTYTIYSNMGETTATSTACSTSTPAQGVSCLPLAMTASGAQTIWNTIPDNSQGQTFLYWNTRSDGTGVTYVGGNTITPSADVTLYAMWATPSTITYDGNGATGGSAPSAVSTTGAPGSTEQTISGPNSLVNPGFDFAGWNTAANGTGIPYEPGEVFVPSGNDTLYAVWTPAPVVTPANPVNVDVAPGTALPGANVDYVVPDLEPGTLWNLTIDPAGEPPVEIDAGYVPDSGTISGITQLPSTVVPGENTLVFSGTDPEGNEVTITTVIVVSPTGTFISQAAGIRVSHILANTGPNMLPAFALGSLMLIVGGAAVLIARRRNVS